MFNNGVLLVSAKLNHLTEDLDESPPGSGKGFHSSGKGGPGRNSVHSRRTHRGKKSSDKK